MSSLEVLPDQIVAFTSDTDELVAFLSRNLQRDTEHCRALAREILTVAVAGPRQVDLPPGVAWQSETELA